jgi:hypothetical protein
MLFRSTRRQTARLLLGVLLFAQAALAIAACEWSGASAVQAVAASSAQPSCHEAPPQNANLCLAHCLGSDQGLLDHEVAVAPWEPKAPLIVLLPEAAATRSPDLVYVLPRAGAPPPRILLHSFLI